MTKKTVPAYQVQVTITHTGRVGIAEFASMTEAYLYMIETVGSLLFLFYPDVVDADWSDDDHFSIVGRDGRVHATASLIFAETIVH